MTKVHHFSLNNKALFLTSMFVLGASCLSGMAEGPQQAPSGDLTTKQDSDHPVRDTIIEAGKKTAEIAGNVAERTRKGIHAATDDLKKEEDHRTPKNGSNEGESEDEDDEVEEKAKDVSDSAKEKASDLYEKGKKKAKKTNNKTSQKLAEGKEKTKKAYKSAKNKTKETFETAKENTKDAVKS